MTKRKIETIEQAVEAIEDLLPADVQLYVHWSADYVRYGRQMGNRTSRGNSMNGRVHLGIGGPTIEFEGSKPSDLVRRFLSDVLPQLVPPPPPKRVKRIEGTVVRRLPAPGPLNGLFREDGGL